MALVGFSSQKNYFPDIFRIVENSWVSLGLGKFKNWRYLKFLLSFQFREILEFQEKRVETFVVFDFRVGSCR